MGTHSKPLIGVHEKWRLSFNEACALCGISETFAHQLMARGDYPPPVLEGAVSGGKRQWIAREVRAWADAEDWRAMVAKRLGEDWAKKLVRGVANAS